jgi:DNA-binding NarL/FixJ family response regulator
VIVAARSFETELRFYVDQAVTLAPDAVVGTVAGERDAMNQDIARHTTTPKMVSVYASDPLTAAGIGVLLAGHPEYVLLPEQHEAEADVVVISADSVTADFVDTLREINTRTTARLVLILTDRWMIDVFTAAEFDLAAVIPRAEISAERLVRAVDTVMRGGAELPADMQGRLLTQIHRLQRDTLGPRGLNAHGLDDREVEVLRLLAAGCSVRDIGIKLSYSERTVKNILHVLLTRLGLHNRTHAVAYAIRAGII